MELNDVYRLWDRFDLSQAAELELDIHGAHLKLRKMENGAGSAAGASIAAGCAATGSQIAAENAAGTPIAAGIAAGSQIAADGAAASSLEAIGREMAGSSLSEAAALEASPNGNKDQASSVGTPVKAPLVGTFYRAPSPEEEPFVKVGQAVKKGDTIGIIEAMKLMNEVPAVCDGIVSEIPAEDGSMVQFDELLVVIEPA